MIDFLFCVGKTGAWEREGQKSGEKGRKYLKSESIFLLSKISFMRIFRLHYFLFCGEKRWKPAAGKENNRWKNEVDKKEEGRQARINKMDSSIEG